jgi:hypothetical protein
MKRQDVLLAALSKAPAQSLTPVQIQKAMFLVAEETPQLAPQHFYEFEKYNYGPFCTEIYADLSGLQLQGLVAVEQPAGSRVRRYRLTAEGEQASTASSAKLDPVLSAYVNAVVQWVTRLSFQDLVRAIYRKYPAYKENSVFSG